MLLITNNHALYEIVPLIILNGVHYKELYILKESIFIITEEWMPLISSTFSCLDDIIFERRTKFGTNALRMGASC